MISKEETFKKAFEIKRNTLRKKASEYNMFLASAYESCPRLKEIDSTLATVGATLAITAISGDKNKLEDYKKRSSALSVEKKIILDKCNVKDIVYDCPLCKDTGYINGNICECVKKIARSITVSELNRQMPLDESKFENFDLKYYSDKSDEEGANPRRRMTGILRLCTDYAINFNPRQSPNLLFMGQSGLGKTHLTLALVSAVIEKGFLPVYGPAQDLFTQIEDERFSGINKGTYQTMIECDLLVIDDLGTEMATSFTKSALYNLINTRLLSKRPTIINTNLSMKEMEQRYTARICSRLIGSYDSHRFLGNDIRQQKILKK